MNKELKILLKELELVTEIPVLKTQNEWINAKVEYCRNCKYWHDCITGNSQEEIINIETGEITQQEIPFDKTLCTWEEEKCKLSRR